MGRVEGDAQVAPAARSTEPVAGPRSLLTVVILTFNEALHIERAIRSVRRIATHIVVVDSGSTDDTVELARRAGASVLHHAFVNQAQQFQWALDHAEIDSDWVMRLDADETVDAALQDEILTRLPQLGADTTGINLRRKHIFMGRWIRHGGRYPLLMLRIWRRGFGRVEDRWMDEHITVRAGRVITFDATFADHNLNDLGYFIDKHNRYATREAIEVINQKRRLFARDEPLNSASTSRQASVKRWLKERVFNRLSFSASATLYFMLRYFIQRGFLDGREGLIYHVLQGFWYRFLVGAKVIEFERCIADVSDRRLVLQRLSAATGFDLLAEAERRSAVTVPAAPS